MKIKRSRASRRAATAAAVALVLGAALTACGSGSSAAGEGEETVKVGVIAGSPPGVYTAIEHGLFDKQHIKVKLTTLSGGPALVAAVQSGSVDVAWADMFAWSSAIEQGFDLRVINPANGVQEGQHTNVLLAKPDSGIKSAADLKGKKIGVPAQALTTVEIKKWLADSGADPDSPTYTTVNDRTTSGGLVAGGQIDVAATSGAFVTKWEADYGLKVIGSYDGAVPTGAATSGYGTTAKYANGHKDLIERFVKAVREGVKEYQAASPADQNKIVVKHGGADVTQLESKYPGALKAAADASDTELSGPFNTALENKWLQVGYQYGALKKPIDITKYLWPTATAK